MSRPASICSPCGIRPRSPASSRRSPALRPGGSSSGSASAATIPDELAPVWRRPAHPWRAHQRGADTRSRIPHGRGGDVPRALLQSRAGVRSARPSSRRRRSWSAAARTRRCERTAKLGDGWLGVWISPRRFAEGTARIAGERERAWRGAVAAHPPAVGRHRPHAGARRRSACEKRWSIPTASRSNASSATPPADGRRSSREALAPYLAAGCRRFNVVPEAPSLDAAIEAVGTLEDPVEETPHMSTLEFQPEARALLRGGPLARRRSVERLRRARATSTPSGSRCVLDDRAVTYASCAAPRSASPPGSPRRASSPATSSSCSAATRSRRRWRCSAACTAASCSPRCRRCSTRRQLSALVEQTRRDRDRDLRRREGDREVPRGRGRGRRRC